MLREMQGEVHMGRPFESRLHIDYNASPSSLKHVYSWATHSQQWLHSNLSWLLRGGRCTHLRGLPTQRSLERGGIGPSAPLLLQPERDGWCWWRWRGRLGWGRVHLGRRSDHTMKGDVWGVLHGRVLNVSNFLSGTLAAIGRVRRWKVRPRYHQRNTWRRRCWWRRRGRLGWGSTPSKGDVVGGCKRARSQRVQLFCPSNVAVSWPSWPSLERTPLQSLTRSTIRMWLKKWALEAIIGFVGSGKVKKS